MLTTRFRARAPAKFSPRLAVLIWPGQRITTGAAPRRALAFTGRIFDYSGRSAILVLSNKFRWRMIALRQALLCLEMIMGEYVAATNR